MHAHLPRLRLFGPTRHRDWMPRPALMSIVRFREAHGRIESENQLKQLDTIDDEILSRIKRAVVFQ